VVHTESHLRSSATPQQNVLPVCQEEVDSYLRCIREHPAGLRATDCEEIASIYRSCMTDAKAKAQPA